VSAIAIAGVTKRYDTGHLAVRGIDLEIASGEFMVLVGPSGCGKTTLLRMIAGLEEVSTGRIAIGGRDITRVPPQQRDIAMVFQNYALYPHMSVRENLGYGLKVRKVARDEQRRRVANVAALLGLEPFLDRRPGELSGGQRQRVAIGRAIVREPVVFLMDEPLSNLDAKLRVGMRGELARLHKRLGVTTVYVTHDQVEAMTLGHRVAVMRDGAVLQVGPPEDLYRRPCNLFVAAFIGSPAINLVEAEADAAGLRFAGFHLVCRRLPPPGRVILGIRPEAMEAAELAAPGLPQIEITAEVVETQGADSYVGFTVDAPRVEAEQVAAAAEGESDELIAEARARFMARVNPRRRVAAGEPLRLALDPDQFLFFDPATGAALPAS
jgi:multiple sugar transport system ATP-binding protein